MRFDLWLLLISCTTASRYSLSEIQGLFSRKQQRVILADANNQSVSLDQSTQKKKKKEKYSCQEVVAGSEARSGTHLWGGDCKCPTEHVVAGRSWDCADALGKRKFSSKIGPSSCYCAPTSECNSMVPGAQQRNSYKKNPDRPCKCVDQTFVLEGKAAACAVFLGERYFPNTLPPHECSCGKANLKEYACSEIATGATDSEKDGKCVCPDGTFIGGEDQQCKDFYGASFFPKRLKPGLCMCSANAKRPGMGAGTRVHMATPVLGVLLGLWTM